MQNWNNVLKYLTTSAAINDLTILGGTESREWAIYSPKSPGHQNNQGHAPQNSWTVDMSPAYTRFMFPADCMKKYTFLSAAYSQGIFPFPTQP